MSVPPVPDYYDLLGIGPDADTEQIRTKIVDAERRSRSRASKAPREDQRAEARRQVKLLGAAFATLLDAGKRREYDAALAAQRRATASGQRHDDNSRTPPPPTGPSPDEVSAMLAQFHAHMATGDMRQAADVAGFAVRAAPANPDTWIALAEVHACLGLLAEAVQEVQTACSLQPGEPHYRYKAGRMFLFAGDPASAAQQFEAAARMAPDNAGYKVETADALRMARNYPEAIGWFDEALALDPANVRCRDGLAESWLRQGYAPFSRGLDGAFCLLSREAGLETKRCAEMGLSAQSDDGRLVKELNELYGRAVAALSLVFRWPRRFRWLIRLLVAAVALAVVGGQSAAAYGTGALGLALILGAGLRPRWWYDARQLASVQVWVTYDERGRW